MITIQAQLSKKVPIAGEQYSSRQASITISAEVSDPSQVVQEAKRIFGLAELAVNQQLGISVAPVAAAATPNVQPVSQHQRPSQPFQRSNRGPAPITDSQLRFLNRLIQQGNHSPEAILQDFQIGSLRDLSCKDAVDLIGRLKAGVA